MSGSAALEYGFPSTHSTNAVSVAVYSIYVLKYERPDMNSTINTLLQILSYCYAFSIVLGRLYCGMHGFFDVVIGGLLGAFLSIIQCVYGDPFDHYIHSGTLKDIFIIVLVILVLVRIHPEPADDCPCFDDSVAFSGVMIGIEYGNWHFAKSQYSWSLPSQGTVPFDLSILGWPVTILRIVLGVAVIFAWRGTMKPTLLRILPPIFRVIESVGLTLPRRFFKQASEYKRVPRQPGDDNVIPHVSEIPHMLSSFRRRRAVSMGPQSEADAYETLAYREKRRRDSLSSSAAMSPLALSPTNEGQPTCSKSSPKANGSIATRPRSRSSIEEYRSMMGSTPDQSPNVLVPTGQVDGVGRGMPTSSQTEEKELFSNLQKPRVRYDVEVVTKLIVYSGESSSILSQPEVPLLTLARHRVAGNRGQSHPVRSAWVDGAVGRNVCDESSEDVVCNGSDW